MKTLIVLQKATKRTKEDGARRSSAALPFILFVLFVTFCLNSARATQTNVTAVITWTNTASGFTNGQQLTVNSSTRTATNNVTSGPSTRIQATNDVGWAATNTYLHLRNFSPSGVVSIQTTNTNSIIIVSTFGTPSLTVSFSANVGTVTYSTNGNWLDPAPILGTNASVPTESGRTNNINRLIDLLSDTRATSILPNGVAALVNIIDRISQQSMTNKVMELSTNRHGAIENMTSLSGVATAVTNGLFTNATLLNPKSTNLVNYGKAIRSEGAGVNSYQAGSNAVASTNFATATGNDALASGLYASANGYSAQATNNYAIADGAYAVAQEYGAAIGPLTYAATNAGAFGVGSVASGKGSFAGVGASVNGAYAIGMGIGVETDSPYGIHIGYGAGGNALWNGVFGQYGSAPYSNSMAIGPRDFQGNGATTTRTNQLMLGTANEEVNVPGTLAAANVPNLRSTGTNRLEGSISYSSSTISSVANGHNIIDVGTNTIAYLTGAPTAAWTLGGIIGDIRDNRILTVVNKTGFDVTVWNEDGIVPTAAQRILTYSTVNGTNVTLQGNGIIRFLYSDASQRWLLDSDLGDLVSTNGSGVTSNANLLFVDAAGNDSTAIKGRRDLPFATPVAAKAAAVDGDTVVVYPGVYQNCTNLFKGGVNWSAPNGGVWMCRTNHTNDTGVGTFDDRFSGAVTCSVVGFSFNYSTGYETTNILYSPAYGPTNVLGCLVITNARSKVTFKFDQIDYQSVKSSADAAAAIWLGDGTNCFITGNLIRDVNLTTNYFIGVNIDLAEDVLLESKAIGVYWTGGEHHIDIKRILCKYNSFYAGGADNRAGNAWVNGDFYFGQFYVAGSATQPNWRIWANVKELQTNRTNNNSAGAITFGFGGKLYYVGEKVSESGTMADPAGIAITQLPSSPTCESWITVQKVSASGKWITASSGTMHAAVQHFEDLGTVDRGINVVGGKLSLSGNDAVVTNATGSVFYHSAGDVSLSGLRLSATNSSAAPVLLATNGAVLQSCTLLGKAAGFTIAGTTSVSANLQGCWGRTGESNNVSWLVGPWTVDSNVR